VPQVAYLLAFSLCYGYNSTIMYTLYPRSTNGLLLALVSVLSLALALPASAAVIKGPYLQKVTPTSISVMWETSAAEGGTVQYGLTTAYGSTATSPASLGVHEVSLTGLTGDTLYHYRLNTGADHTFRTAPPRGKPVRIVAYGDTRTNISTHAAVVQAIIKSNPAIVLHTGDLVSTGSDPAVWGPQFFTPAALLMDDVVMFTSLGNHEGNASYYYSFFSNPTGSGDEAYYSFDYGDAHIIVLDTNSGYHPYTPGSPQYTWLVSDLQAAQASGIRWIIAFFHHPPYSSASHGGDANVQQYLVPLFEQYGVNMVFSGHDHDYERSYKSGITYVVAGAGGAPLYAVNQNPNPYQVYAESTYHHCVLDITPTTITLRAVKNDGTTFDRLYLPTQLTVTSDLLPTGWNLISLPVRPVDPEPTSVFLGLSLDLNLARYDPIARSYVFYRDATPTEFGLLDEKSGYWLNLLAPSSISFLGQRPTARPTMPSQAQGWHLFGCPEIPPQWTAELSVTNLDTTENKLLASAATQGWIGLPFFTYDPAIMGYQTLGLEPWDATAWQPWQGAWVDCAQARLELCLP